MSGDFPNGVAPYRRRRTGFTAAARAERSTHAPLTPVCQGCRYPLLSSDPVCPRCRVRVPWQTLDQPQGEAVVEGESA